MNDSNQNIINEWTNKDYEYGFVTDIKTDFIPKGLNEDIITDRRIFIHINMKYGLSIISLFFIYLSCSEKRDSINSIDYNSTEEISIFDFVDSIDVIQLETNDNSLIWQINKVIFYNNRLYIHDVRQQVILCFDSSGKFLFKINQKGQGPDEYLYLGDFNIDTFNNQILLLEPFGHLLLFDLEGHFIDKIRLPKEIVAYNEVFPIDKDNLIFISLNEYGVLFYSRNANKITDKKYPRDSYLFSSTGKTYTYNENVYFSEPYTNKVINLTEQTEFFWNFGKKNNSEDQLRDLKKLTKSEDLKVARDFVGEGKLNYKIFMNYESSRYKICIMDCGKFKFKHIFYDKTLNQPFIFEKTKENIQFVLFPNFYGKYSIMYDKQYAGYDEAKKTPDLNIDDLLIYYDRDILTVEQKKIIDSHTENDNPFLIMYNLKQ